MSDCRNGGRDVYEPRNRVDIRVKFTDENEIDYHLPLNLMDREIAYIDVDGERWKGDDMEVGIGIALFVGGAVFGALAMAVAAAGRDE